MEIYDKRIKDLRGQRFFKLTVVEFVGVKYHEAQWKCICDCGNETIVSGHSLRKGTTKSCGCYQRERLITHGMKYTRLYEKWNHMLERCRNPKNPSYNRYGGRGIKVCEEWKIFENFEKWANSNGYKDGLSIDRINVNGDYEPKNCRFATAKQQANNKSNNHFIEINGETHTVSEWADITGLKQNCILGRISRGWNEQKAVLTPLKRR